MIPASLYRNFQIVATTTREVIVGRKNAARKSPRRRSERSSRSAEPSPSAGPMPIPRITKAIVFSNAFWKRALPEHVGVVLEPDELGRLDPVVRGQAPVRGDDHRDDQEQDGRRQRGRDQQVACRRPAEAAPPRHPDASSGDPVTAHLDSASSVWDAASSSAACGVDWPSSADCSESVMNVSISVQAPT